MIHNNVYGTESIIIYTLWEISPQIWGENIDAAKI